MPFDIVDLQDTHLSQAAALVARRYAVLRAQIAELPQRYENVSEILPLLQRLNRQAPGVAAIESGRLLGFLSGWMVSGRDGRGRIYVPEWAAAAEDDHARLVYEEMYTVLAGRWVAWRFLDHFITVFANDRLAHETWHWLGFGFVVMDGIRDLAPISPPTGAATAGIEIRRATMDDLRAVRTLWQGLCRHLVASPCFLTNALQIPAGKIERALAGEHNAYWLALRAGQPVAYLGIGPASDDAATIIVDEGTASVLNAFTLADQRGTGIGTALLDTALAWARARGYVRCAVDFESMNRLAARFWPRYFTLCCVSLARHIDERILAAAEPSP